MDDGIVFIEVHTVHDRRPMWLRVDEIESILDEAEYTTHFPQEVPDPSYVPSAADIVDGRPRRMVTNLVELTTKATRIAMKSGDAGFVIERGERVLQLMEEAYRGR